MLSRKYMMGIMLTMLCMGFGIIFLVVIMMTPNYEWHWLCTFIFGSLLGGFLFGVKMLDDINKILKTVDRLNREFQEQEYELPDWRV